MVTSGSRSADAVPGRRRRCSTTPACGAVIASSIFIDSSTSRTSPSATGSPSATWTSSTVPGIGACSASPAQACSARAAQLGPRLQRVAVAADPDDVAVDGDLVAPRDPVELGAQRAVLRERRPRRPRAPGRVRPRRRAPRPRRSPSNARRQGPIVGELPAVSPSQRRERGGREQVVGRGRRELVAAGARAARVHVAARGRRGRASSARVNAVLVATPSTAQDASARSSRASAVARSGPWAMTFASSGS